MDQFTSHRYPVHASEGPVFGPAGRTPLASPAQHPDTNTAGEYRSYMNNDGRPGSRDWLRLALET